MRLTAIWVLFIASVSANAQSDRYYEPKNLSEHCQGLEKRITQTIGEKDKELDLNMRAGKPPTAAQSDRMLGLLAQQWNQWNCAVILYGAGKFPNSR